MAEMKKLQTHLYLHKFVLILNISQTQEINIVAITPEMMLLRKSVVCLIARTDLEHLICAVHAVEE